MLTVVSTLSLRMASYGWAYKLIPTMGSKFGFTPDGSVN